MCGCGCGCGCVCACVRACVRVCVCIHNFNIIVFVLMHSFSVWSEWFPFAVMIKKFWNHCSWLSYVVTEFVLATISFVGWCLMFCQSVIAQFAGGSTPPIGFPPILGFCSPPPPPPNFMVFQSFSHCIQIHYLRLYKTLN